MANTQAVKGKEKQSVAVLHLRRVISYIVLGILCFLCLFFFYVLIINTTHTHNEIQKGFMGLPGTAFVDNFNAVMNDASLPVLKGIINSLIVSSGTALLAIYFSALTAYGLYAYDFKLKKLATTFILLIMSMPTQISALGFVRLVDRLGMSNTLWPLFIPAVASPTVFYFMLQYLKSSLPMSIVEAARIDGSSEFATFNRVVLPLMKPAMAVQAIFTFVGAWNNYFTPALILDAKTKPTLPILIATLRSKDLASLNMGHVYMMIAIAILPVIIIYLFLSKFIVAGVALGGVKE